tara:strand:- start:135 stop:401 length:267 start_codon:yes stop_codon:yes gene_type:complete
MNNIKASIVTTQELWTEFEKMKTELKEEILYDIKENKTKPLYTRKEVAELFDVSNQTVINWSSKGILNPRYIQGRVYYKFEELQNLMK